MTRFHTVIKFQCVFGLSLLLLLSCGGRQNTEFEKASSGIITQSTDQGQAILEWYSMGDMPVSFLEAETFADTLSVAGGCWRLPTLAELGAIKHDGSSMNNIPSCFASTGWFLWSSEKDGESSYWGLNLYDGSGYESRHIEYQYGDARVFVVKHIEP